MALQKRFNGDSQGVVNVDRSRNDALAAQIVSTGIGKHITVYKITGPDFTLELGVGGAVEAILRTLQVAATTIAYQVTGTQLAVICEATGWATDGDLQAAIQAIGARAEDLLVPVTAFDFSGVTVSSAGGLVLA